MVSHTAGMCICQSKASGTAPAGNDAVPVTTPRNQARIMFDGDHEVVYAYFTHSHPALTRSQLDYKLQTFQYLCD